MPHHLHPGGYDRLSSTHPRLFSGKRPRHETDVNYFVEAVKRLQRIADLADDNANLQTTLRAAQKELGEIHIEHERRTVWAQELAAAREAIEAQLAAAQSALAEARISLAAHHKEKDLLTERLQQAEARADQLTEEKMAWLQERGVLARKLRDSK